MAEAVQSRLRPVLVHAASYGLTVVMGAVLVKLLTGIFADFHRLSLHGMPSLLWQSISGLPLAIPMTFSMTVVPYVISLMLMKLFFRNGDRAVYMLLGVACVSQFLMNHGFARASVAIVLAGALSGLFYRYCVRQFN